MQLGYYIVITMFTLKYHTTQLFGVHYSEIHEIQIVFSNTQLASGIYGS